MNGATFGALAAAKTLLDAGFKGRQAEAVAATIRDGRAGLATKADLDTAITTLRADIYRALWIQGAGIVAIMMALKAVG